MNKLFFMEGNRADKITYYHLLVFVATLPFDRLYSELALISLCIHTLIHFRKQDVKAVNWHDLVVPASLYLLTMAGTLHSSYKSEAFSLWERQAALILFPLIVSVNPFPFRRYVANICMALSFSSALLVAALYWMAVHAIFMQHLPFIALFTGSFSNHNFSAPVDMHATYLSMYLALGAVTVVSLWVKEPARRYRVLYSIVFVVLLAGMIQLSSRAVLIAFCVVMLTVVPFFFITPKKRGAYWIASLLTAVILTFAVARMDFVKARFTTGLKEDLTTQGDLNNNSQEPRMVRWQAARSLMLASPVVGHGSGSEIPLLREVYYRQKLYNSYIERLNIHNQYLSMIIQTGIAGLVVFLFVLFAGFTRSIKNRDGLFCAFLVIVSVVCFSENILDGNKGIFFFACFFSVFYIGGRKPLIQK